MFSSKRLFSWCSVSLPLEVSGMRPGNGGWGDKNTPRMASSRYNACFRGRCDAGRSLRRVLDMAPNRTRLHHVRPMGTMGRPSISSRFALRYRWKGSRALVTSYGVCSPVCILLPYHSQCLSFVVLTPGRSPNRTCAFSRFNFSESALIRH